jgi:hypothetical protein
MKKKSFPLFFFIVIFYFSLNCSWNNPFAKFINNDEGGEGAGAGGFTMPAGCIMAYWGTTAPDGWLLCNGDLIPTSGTTYENLKTLCGPNTPDLRGMFLRGIQGTRSDGKGDPDVGSRIGGGNMIGSYQDDDYKSHSHYIPRRFSNTYNGDTVLFSDDNEAYYTDHGMETGLKGGNETRPKNVYVNYIIKY